ncbi:alginate O-acetyltransferase AlgX-related protein [Deinococcus yavapaiensis]|uniref:Acetyltransferase AlgX (SGNH hydrolase-like protein) n=1 Tax=Deinococcus yavapaiensis KR-236 TaxID=694435 RepID=A0A318SJT1_9DEIO|nr:hypothetical protein [Deinococcus yavapaiensis]PYE52818.1 acetyltransferase AlgX (SGNH hydrolase-like protein) [Deinococcus yavapaiensis KR-236]
MKRNPVRAAIRTMLSALGAWTLASTSAAQSAAPTAVTPICEAAFDARRYAPEDTWARLVNQGKDGWLFGYYSFENSPPALTGRMRDEFIRFRDALRAQGTELLMVVIPGKGLVTWDKVDVATLRRPTDINFLRSRYAEYIASFRSAGVYASNVVALGLSDTSGQALYFRYDHHWTPRLAELVAEDLAKEMRSRAAYRDLPAFEPKVRRYNALYPGSFAAMVKKYCGQILPPEPYVSLVTETTGAGGDLLDAEEPGIALVGDSHSVESTFATLLRQKLQRDLVNHSVPGGAATAPLETYLLSGNYRAAPPRFLIWSFETGGIQPGFLARMAAAVQGPCTGTRRVFAGTVEALAAETSLPLPTPVTVTTGDYVHLQLTDRAIRTVNLNGAETALHSRTSNTGTFYLELPPGPLDRVLLRFPTAPQGTIQVSVCRHVP